MRIVTMALLLSTPTLAGPKQTITVSAITHHTGTGKEKMTCWSYGPSTLSTKCINHAPRTVTQKVQLDNGIVYTIACSANWKGSNCHSLKDGNKYSGEIDKKAMWISAPKGGNQEKLVRIKYKIYDIQSS